MTELDSDRDERIRQQVNELMVLVAPAPDDPRFHTDGPPAPYGPRSNCCPSWHSPLSRRCWPSRRELVHPIASSDRPHQAQGGVTFRLLTVQDGALAFNLKNKKPPRTGASLSVAR